MSERTGHFRTFKPSHTDSVKRCQDEVMGNIIHGIGVDSYDQISHEILNKRGLVSKDTLCTWLVQVCTILNEYSIPLLECALPVYEECPELRAEKIKDQRTIIELQEEVIKKKEEELKAVKESVESTVKCEIKSYTSAVTKTCAAALAPRKLTAAIKTVAENEDRKRNVIIYGIKEEDNEVVSTKVEDVLAEIDEKPIIKDCCRVGNIKEKSIRPVKFSLSSTDMVQKVLRKARRLRLKEQYQSVYIFPDRTFEERQAFKKQREDKLKQAKKEKQGIGSEEGKEPESDKTLKA